MNEKSIHSYPSVFAIGHPSVEELFLDEVVVEEKVDGSQFSFGYIDGEVHMRSKGAEIFAANPEKMFGPAVDYVMSIEGLIKGRAGDIFRCEYLGKPKHNTIAYDRIPENHLMLFDVEISPNRFLDDGIKRVVAEELGIEPIPHLATTTVTSSEQVVEFLERESVLGGSRVEGVVVKNYSRFGRDKKILIGKYVSEAFKEKHAREWKGANPQGKDIIAQLTEQYRTQARWRKAIQHLRDEGELEHSPRDIGKLLKEISTDTHEDSHEEIKEALFKWAWPKISRGLNAGFPEFYKAELMAGQFGEEVAI